MVLAACGENTWCNRRERFGDVAESAMSLTWRVTGLRRNIDSVLIMVQNNDCKCKKRLQNNINIYVSQPLARSMSAETETMPKKPKTMRLSSPLGSTPL